MTTKQILFTMMTFIFINSFGSMPEATSPYISQTSQQKDFVFDRGRFTEIKGNNIGMYLRRNRFQQNVTPAFKHIRVIELTKDTKDFKERGTLGSLQKEMFFLSDKFAKHATVNNAIYCDDIEQAEDYDGNMYSIGAIVYRTQNLEKCPFVREYVAQQKLAAEKNKAAESAAPAAGN